MQRWETTSTIDSPQMVRTIRHNRDGARPLLFWILFIVDAFAGGMAAIWLQYGQVVSIGVYALWFGIFCASVVGLVVLVWRMVQHDLFQHDQIERFEEPPAAAPAPIVQPVVTTSDQSTIRYGKFKFTAEEWQRLARALADNDGRVTRDGVAAAGCFQNITANWRDVAGEFARLGWTRNGQLTDEGAAWFSQYGYPPPPK